MKPLSYFDVTAYNPGAPNRSGRLDSAFVRGQPMGAHPTDKERLMPAGPKSFLGFLIRDAIVGGASNDTRLFAGGGAGQESDNPVAIADPYIVGHYGGVRQADEFEAEGNALVLSSGTGAITAATVAPQQLSFEPNSGKVRIAQSGDTVFFELSAVLTDPNDLYDEVNNTFRIRANRC